MRVAISHDRRCTRECASSTGSTGFLPALPAPLRVAAAGRHPATLAHLQALTMTAGAVTPTAALRRYACMQQLQHWCVCDLLCAWRMCECMHAQLRTMWDAGALTLPCNLTSCSGQASINDWARENAAVLAGAGATVCCVFGSGLAFGSLQQSITDIKSDVASLRADVKSDVASLRADMKSLGADVKSLSTSIGKMETHLELLVGKRGK